MPTKPPTAAGVTTTPTATAKQHQQQQSQQRQQTERQATRILKSHLGLPIL